MKNPNFSESTKKLGRRVRGRRGQALIEVALVLPVLILIVVGIIEFGRIFAVMQSLSNASREGARVAIVPGNGVGDVNAAVSNYLTSANLTREFQVVSSGVGPAIPEGTDSSVTVNYNHNVFLGGFIPGITGDITLSQTTVMRHR